MLFSSFSDHLDILDTQNFGNGPVVEELQPFEVGAISKNPGEFQAVMRQNCMCPPLQDGIMILYRKNPNPATPTNISRVQKLFKPSGVWFA